MNTTNKILVTIIVLIVIIGGIYLMSRTPKNTADTSAETLERNQDTAQGSVIFSVTDAAADMGAVSEINMKISKVETHNSERGWATVSTTPRTYSLLALNSKKQSELLADIKVKAGTYDQVRLVIDSVAVKMKTGTIKTAKLPANQFTVNTTLVVNADETSSVNFDFLASKSLYTTDTNEYVFAPVVKTETRSDTTVTVDQKNVVTMSGGHVDNTNTSGMNLDGSVKLNFQLDTNQKILINSNNTINIDGILK